MSGNKWPYNTRQWRTLRRMILLSEPVCRYCQRQPATIADHIIPVRGRPDLAFVVDNIQGLCAVCHQSVKAREEGRWGGVKGFDSDGNPLRGWKA